MCLFLFLLMERFSFQFVMCSWYISLACRGVCACGLLFLTSFAPFNVVDGLPFQCNLGVFECQYVL